MLYPRVKERTDVKDRKGKDEGRDSDNKTVKKKHSREEGGGGRIRAEDRNVRKNRESQIKAARKRKGLS